MPINEQQLVQLLGAIGGPVGGGIAGGAVAPDQKLLSGLMSGGGSLAGGIGGGALGMAGGGALGMLGGAGAGSLMGLSEQDKAELMAILGSLGGGLGGTAGAMAGSGMGAGAGYQAMQGPPQSGPPQSGPPSPGGQSGGGSKDDKDDKDQEKEGSAMTQKRAHAFAVGALEKLAQCNVDPAQYVQAAVNSNDENMRKTAAAMLQYAQAVQNGQLQKQAADTRAQVHSFAEGALEKLAQHNVDPVEYVKAAVNSNDETMRKTAAALVQYDQDMRQEQHKFAIGALQKMAEYNVDPNDFVKAAQNNGDGAMRKIAATIVNLDQAVREQEKTAGPLGALWGSTKDLGKGVNNLLNPLASGRVAAREMGEQSPELGAEAHQALNQVAGSQLRRGMPAAATGLGLGGAGLGAAHLMQEPEPEGIDRLLAMVQQQG